MFDLILSGGTVVDGSGRDRLRADVGVTDDRIAAVGDLSAATARRTCDVTGLIVSPGFIDTHTHLEGWLLVDPIPEFALYQGITSVILGLDGMSYAPLSRDNYIMYRDWLSGLLGRPPTSIATASVAAFRQNFHKRAAVNTAYLIPHGAIRLGTLGFRDRPLTGPALDQALTAVRVGLEEGAVGFSTGSAYYPGPWADTAELVELCKVVSAHGATYVNEPRMRNLDRATAADGVGEAIEIAQRSGTKLHLAHFRTSPQTAGSVEAFMAKIDDAIASGLDCTFDIYPYPTGSSILISRLPPSIQEGGPTAILERLKDPVTRSRIAQYLDTEHSESLGSAVLSYVGGSPELEGRSLADLARERTQTLGVCLCDLLVSSELAVGYLVSPPDDLASWWQTSADCMTLLSRDDYMVCSDFTPAGRFCHPRSYGAFPRFLGRLRHEFPVMSLEQMIVRMTSRPADRFGLSQRGLLQTGYFADIVAFDEIGFVDTATYDNPRRNAPGVRYLLVNGEFALDEGTVTRAVSGRAIP
jgi:N-acyl-D-amino-acid deacylase